jgi:hypothetical protein
MTLLSEKAIRIKLDHPFSLTIISLSLSPLQLSRLLLSLYFSLLAPLHFYFIVFTLLQVIE